MIVGRDRLLTIARRANSLLTTDGREVAVCAVNSSLTRFARSEIHQTVDECDLTIRFRAIQNGATGQAVCNLVEDGPLAAAAAVAADMARAAPRSGPGPRLARPQDLPDTVRIPESVIAFDARERAQGAAEIISIATGANCQASGAIRRDLVETAIVNNEGLCVYQVTAEADALVIIASEHGSGYARQVVSDPGAISFSALGHEAVSRCAREAPSRLDPGRYTVLLEPYAVADMIMALGATGFGGDKLRMGSSFMTGKLGERLLDERLTIIDDCRDPAGITRQFDSEGVVGQRVEIVVQGTPRAVVHDLTSAALAGTDSTGHASTMGPGTPLAASLLVSPGDASHEDLLAGIDRGVYVTRFHYIGIVNAARTDWCGMTRDGTYLIEGGRLTRPVHDLRFSDRIVASLSNVVAIGRDRLTSRGYFGCATVPAMVIDGFQFTSQTRQD